MSSDRKMIGAGWLKKDKKGEDYISLSFKSEEIEGMDLSQCWVNMFVNSKKSKPNQPDYNISASPKDQQATPRPPAPKQGAFPKPKNFAPSYGNHQEDEDLGF